MDIFTLKKYFALLVYGYKMELNCDEDGELSMSFVLYEQGGCADDHGWFSLRVEHAVIVPREDAKVILNAIVNV